MTETHHDTGNDVGGGLPALGVHIGQRDPILPWDLSADQRDQGQPSVPRARRFVMLGLSMVAPFER